MNKRNSKHFFIAIGFLAIGIFMCIMLIVLKRGPAEKPKRNFAPLVSVEKIAAENLQMIIHSYGSVEPEVKVQIVPQVSGNVIWINPKFKVGGFIKANEPVIKIDQQDYLLALQQSQAQLQQALVKLEIEQADAEIAKQNWYQMNPGVEPASDLVLHKPQIRQAKAVVDSARAQLNLAKLNLDRTTVKMPIDICISQVNADLGQMVRAAAAVGSAFGIEKFEVSIPLETSDLAWFDIPSDNLSYNNRKPSQKFSNADIVTSIAEKKYQWQGKVVRTAGQIDRKSRMISVIVEVDKPLESTDKPALLPGDFVDVFIKGKIVKNAFKISRNNIHNRDKIWLARDNRLKIMKINILRADQKYVYTSTEIDKDSLLITSNLDIAIDGMDIRYQISKPKDNQPKTDKTDTSKISASSISQNESSQQ